MDCIKTIGNSIFYIQNQNQVVEYNILSKRKFIRYTSLIGTKICNYHFSNLNKIFIIQDMSGEFRIVRNGCVKRTNVYSDRIFAKFYENIGVICVFLEGLYYNYCMINSNACCLMTTEISYNAKWILLGTSDYICVRKINKNEDFTNAQVRGSINLGLKCEYYLGHQFKLGAFWVTNSDKLVVYEDRYTGSTAINVDNMNVIEVDSMNRSEYIEISNNKFISTTKHFVKIYDIDKMQLIKNISIEFKFIDYSITWNALLTDNLDFYAITNELNIKRIRIGQNYVVDSERLSDVNNKIKVIMDVILCCDIELSEDILNVELYNQIACFIGC